MPRSSSDSNSTRKTLLHEKPHQELDDVDLELPELTMYGSRSTEKALWKWKVATGLSSTIAVILLAVVSALIRSRERFPEVPELYGRCSRSTSARSKREDRTD
jgi:hypothetical protein